MKERPILMGAPMVRAILAGTKTQTRRVVKGAQEDWAPIGPETFNPTVINRHGNREPGPDAFGAGNEDGDCWICCPYGQPGDRLWVRESFAKIDGQTRPWIETDYRATYTHGDRLGDTLGIKKRWTPSIHMPRSASRITLEVEEVRVERLQDISDADAIAEGCAQNHNGYFWGGPHAVSGHKQMATAKDAYADLWNSINGNTPGSWDENPWVWVVAFRRLP